jgi:hypothetical protein
VRPHSNGISAAPTLKAPFPYFGGKRRVAETVWKAFGNPANYVEPFFGSGAVLLARPDVGKIETANDYCGFICNFWRAVQAAPIDVAKWGDWPVNELDLHARHKWLVGRAEEIREQLRGDPDFFDAKVAGWWVWGLCQWIGGGWCVEPNNHKHPKLDGIGKGIHANRGHAKSEAHMEKRPAMDGEHAGRGVHSDAAHRKIPDLTGRGGGRGVHSDAAHSESPPRAHQRLGSNWNVRPDLDGKTAGRGIHAPSAYSPGRRPRLSDAGSGDHLPALGNDRGINGVAAAPCSEWFQELQTRLRRVRVACGDWTRVLGPSVLGKGKNVGGRRPCAVFLDPPYSHEFRDARLYAEDDARISEKVREWAIANGDDPDLRICLAGYFEEHAAAMPASWTVHRWKAARGYAAEGNDNREQETLWFSPHCLPIDGQQGLFEGKRDSGGTP